MSVTSRSHGSNRSTFARLHDRPFATGGLALAVSAAVIVAMMALTGWDAMGRAFGDLHPQWLLLCVGAQLMALAAYVPGFRAPTAASGGQAPRRPLAIWLIVAGFGAHAVGGGFALDRWVLRRMLGDDREATVRVFALGALEYGVLAPAACVCAIVLLAMGSQAQPSMLWAWAIAVPAGFAFGLWMAAPRRRARARTGSRLRAALDAVGVLRLLLLHPRRNAVAWAGLIVYFAADIASLYASLRFVGVTLSVAGIVVAYATGYAATRRSMPAGGAGATAVLMSAALVWTGLAWPAAIAGMTVYRLANLALLLPPAALAQRRVNAVLD
jgi:uncharacterized membrane protein YbhN (UPF0104 family)